MLTNVLEKDQTFDQVSKLLSLIGQPARIQILLAISEQDACVCHLEAILGMRQAGISQHLMVLRKARLVSCHRDSRNIYYHLEQPGVLGILQQAAKLTGYGPETRDLLMARPIPGCPCPQCNPDHASDIRC
jgi:DNA-binding transcriptional ArsR family regulator